MGDPLCHDGGGFGVDLCRWREKPKRTKCADGLCGSTDTEFFLEHHLFPLSSPSAVGGGDPVADGCSSMDGAPLSEDASACRVVAGSLYSLAFVCMLFEYRGLVTELKKSLERSSSQAILFLANLTNYEHFFVQNNQSVIRNKKTIEF